MAIPLVIPAAGESITEVVLAAWLRSEREQVARDEPVVLLETDKANMEVTAPASGRITRILKAAGETAKIGEVIAWFEPGEPPRVVEAGRDRGVIAAPAEHLSPSRRRAERARASSAPPAALEARAPAQASPAQASPAQASPAQAAGEPVAPAPTVAEPLDPVREAGAPAAALRGAEPPPPDEVVPMTPLRRRIAERLVAAKNTSAPVTTFNEVELSEVMRLRKEHQERFRERHGIKLGLMSFFVKAVVDALQTVPTLNAEIRGGDIVYHRAFDIGVAVGGGRGLVVPVIRDAARASFAALERTIADFADRARAGRLRVEELQGGTFTISNGGVYGSMMSTPLLSPPQSGILGIHAIEDRPVVRGGAIVAAPMMYIALTYDHRMVDGREAVGFLRRVKELLESPARLLLEV